MKNLKKVILPVALSVSLLGLTACSAGGGDTYVTTKAGNVNQKDVIDYIGGQQVSKAATSLATKKILLEKYRGKLDKSYVEKKVAAIQAQYGGKEKFEEYLKQQGYTLDKYKEEINFSLAQAYMINDFKAVTEDQIKAEYEKEKLQYNIAHILIAVKSETAPNGLSDEEAKAKADEIKAKINAGEDFATLAKENSTDTASAAKGGELGWSSKSSTSFVTEFANVAYSLKKGEVSDVVKTSFGYHIIKVLDTKELTYEEMKSELVEKLAVATISADSKVYTDALKKLFEEYDVKGNTEDLKNYISNMLAGKIQPRQQQ
ncbi:MULTISPECIES: peptidylprolyl isomerase [unclassified Gemella]|uniref:foldase protein PrsA n=1 Tax=unclassified Gemella TaxID=2624949 RepID=UPI001C045E34|nr:MULTISPECIES: peptidylprolyl isomerase [unclassified Gemella]MBU0278859.1 peptidylprolyl isomerase [Gemella sp. zg-1178]QWQ38557.1 peptidylprolyl isomerase [Gemella sp. zg-570]